MANTYNTGNAIGSADPRDAYDNASNFDEFSNSSAQVFTDRRGVSRKTITGATAGYAAFNVTGPWTTATAYNVNDIWSDSGTFYLVLTDYTSGASAAADIAGGKVIVHQPKDWIVPIETVSDLRAFEPSIANQQIELLGHTNPGVGGGIFWHDASDTTTSDDNGVTIVTAGGKRWKRRLDGFISPQMFGASILNADNTSELQSFANFLPSYPICKSTEVGTMYATHVVFPTCANFKFDFSGIVFKVVAGHDPLDNELIRFNSLQDGVVVNFVTDGNSANVPDVTGSTSYGRILNWRLGDGSKNVEFVGLGMYNALYNGSQWGKNISNITMSNIHYDNIGEHVFYISGSGGGNNKGIRFKGINGGSFSVNPNNSILNHECAFVKSAQTIGDNDDWVIEDGEFRQETDADFAAVILNNGYLNSAKIKNIKVGTHIDAVIYPAGNAYDVEVDGVEQILSGTTRLIYSKQGSGLKLRNYSAKNVNLTSAFEHTNIQVFSEISDSKLGRVNTSAQVAGEYVSDKRRVLFDNVEFTSPPLLYHVEQDFDFVNCQWRESQVSGIDQIGSTTYTAGKWVRIFDCNMSGVTGNTIHTNNANARISVRDMKGDGATGLPPMNGRAVTDVAVLEIDGYECGSLNPVGDVTPASSKLRNLSKYDGTRDFSSYSNTWTIPTSSSSVGFDLLGVLARAPVGTEVNVHPVDDINSHGLSRYWFEVSGSTVTIYGNTAASSPASFYISVVLA